MVAVTYNEGDIIKPYDEFTKEMFIVASGEVNVIARLVP